MKKREHVQRFHINSRQVLAFIFLCLFLALFPLEHKVFKALHSVSSFFYHRVDVLPNAFDRNIFFYFSEILLLGFCIFSFRKKINKAVFFLLIFWVWTGLSLVLSPFQVFYPQVAMWVHFSLTLFFCISFSFLNFPLSWMHKALCVFLVLSLIPCVIGLLQYLSQHSLGLKWLGEPRLVPSDESLSRIAVESSRRWLLDMAGSSHSFASLFRAYGTMDHPNVFGGYIFVSLMLTSYFFVTFPKRKWWLGALLFLQTMVLFVTFSRSALFAWILSLGVVGLFFMVKKQVFPRSLMKTALCAFLLSLMLFGEQWWFRGGLMNYNNGAYASDQVRVDAQRKAFSLIKKYPILGVGWNNYLVGVQKEFPEDTHPMPTHNVYLIVMAESGIPAVLFLLCGIGFAIYLAWKRANPFAYFLLATMVGLLFIGGCDFYPIFDQKGRLLFFLILGLLLFSPGKEKETLRLVKG